MYNVMSRMVNVQSIPVNIRIDSLKIGDRNFTHSMFRQLQEVVLLDPGTGEIDLSYSVIGWVNYTYKKDDIDAVDLVKHRLRFSADMTMEEIEKLEKFKNRLYIDSNGPYSKFKHRKLILLKDEKLFKTLVFEPKIAKYVKNQLKIEKAYKESYETIVVHTRQIFIAT
jgi:hypothetical protein